jgi:2-oxoglutarate ferredoxin oxidoreductase subunit alpha
MRGLEDIPLPHATDIADNTSTGAARRSSLSVAFVGSGGAGVMTAGNILLEAAAAAGYYALMTRSSGPQIRGGEAAAMIRIATHPVECMDDRFHILAGVDWENVHRFAAEISLAADGVIVGDPGRGEVPLVFSRSGAPFEPLPLAKMAREISGGRGNMVLLGYVAELIGLPAGALDRAAETLLGKRPAALEASLVALAAGREAAPAAARLVLEPALAGLAARWLVTGNEATGLGAIIGGVRFVAAYPITPATELLEWLSPALAQVGGVLVQAEDELASINMIIGSSFGGIPALTATSGPGLALMTESLGLAVAAEIPLVVVDVMRVGPSTGIPTKSEQGDLNIALYGLHGDAPHLVLAPNGVADCMQTAQWAVTLAEALQAPAVVLADQFLGQARAVVDSPRDPKLYAERLCASAGNEDYQRYDLTADGVSPMAIPGTAGAAYTADGLEHSERGTPSSQAADHVAQLDKRRRKLELYDYGALWADVAGDGEFAVVTFGSCTGPVREALARLRDPVPSIRLISLRLLAPLPRARLAEALAGVRKLLVIEQNESGQLFHYLRGVADLPPDSSSLRKPGGQQFNPGEIAKHLIEWSSA